MNGKKSRTRLNVSEKLIISEPKVLFCLMDILFIFLRKLEATFGWFCIEIIIPLGREIKIKFGTSMCGPWHLLNQYENWDNLSLYSIRWTNFDFGMKIHDWDEGFPSVHSRRLEEHIGTCSGASGKSSILQESLGFENISTQACDKCSI